LLKLLNKLALQTLMGPRPGDPYAIKSRRGSAVSKAPIQTH